MIRRVLLGLLALWLGGCARCASKVEFESFVSVPTELAAVEELDDPPDVVVKVEKRAAPKGGGGGCGHSPVCLIIIPFAVAEALFPEKLRIATVSEKGRETYHGVFRENGQFVQALAFVDGSWRKIALLQLPELGRNLVVEVAHSPADAEGKPVSFAWSSLQKQVDVLTGYRALLASSTDAEKKSRIVQEMLANARTDALPVAKERVLDVAESAQVKTTALSLVCDPKAPIGSAAERDQLMHELDQKGPDAATSSAALRCFDPKQPERAAAFTARILDAACAEKSSTAAQEWAGKLLSWSGDAAARSAVEPFVDRCPSRERRLFLRLVLGFELDQGELGELAASKDATTASAVISRLDNTQDSHRAILLTELERPDAPTTTILLVLERNGRTPDAAEAKALAGAFLVHERRASLRAQLLARLGATPEAERGQAKLRLEQKLGATSDSERAALHAALVVLGGSEHEAGAARGLRGSCPSLAEARAQPAPTASATPTPSASAKPEASPLERAESACSRRLPKSYWLVEDTPGLVALVLRDAGCKQGDLLDLAAAPPDAKAPERGRVCGGKGLRTPG
ncbi:MAG: hypothetical protein IPM35_28585 [Myxococcales bacterium]|nr:hypothetical protein [Myxococcales bacterium]